MISADDAERALDWIIRHAEPMAQSRAERLYLEQWIKTVRADLMTNKHAGTSVAASEAAALADPRYLAALQAYRDAIKADEHNRFLLAAAEAKIEMYRTGEATRRAEGKIA